MAKRRPSRPDTWMPWYVGDFLRKTMHLDAEEDGAYRRLIDATWIRGGVLRASDKEMAAITKLSLKRWLAIKPTIAGFFEISEHGWHHHRVTEELQYALELHEKRKAGGHKTAETRWGNRDSDSSATQEQEGEQHAEQVAELLAEQLDSNMHCGRPSPSPSFSNEKDSLLHSAPADDSPRRSRAGDDPRFLEFWRAYPSRGQATNPRKPASEKFSKLVARGEDPDEIIAGAKAYAAYCRRSGKAETETVKQAITFLNQEVWKQYAGAAEAMAGGAVNARPQVGSPEAEALYRE